MNEKEELIYSLKIEPEKRAQKTQGLSRKKKIGIGVGVCFLILLALGINRFLKEPEVTVIRATVVQEGLPEIVLTAGGYVEADSTILVSSQINGKIQKLYVDEGSTVKKGDLLAEIEDDDYRAKAGLAQAEFTLARATLNRKSNLLREGVISKAEYDEAVRTFGVKEASLESAKYFLDNAKIRAPIDGTIVKKEKEEGEYLLPGITSEGVPGSAVMKIADLRVMNAEMDILESDLPKIFIDQPTMVFPDALPDRSYKAKLYYIAPQADRQKSIVEVKVRIESPDNLLKPEMSARVYFLKAEAQNKVSRRVMVPEKALLTKKGETYVFIVVKDRLVQKKVGVSSKKDGMAALASGLEGDESVVIKLRPRFHDGLKVVVKSAEVAD